MSETNSADIIYLVLPSGYKETYYKLLYLLAAIGKNIIDDCNYACHNRGNNVFTCWNLFQSALAAYNLGETKKADLYINYIDSQLDIYAKNEDVEIPDNLMDSIADVLYRIDDNGNLVVVVKTEINGELYEETMTISDDSWWYGAIANVDKFDLSALTKTQKVLETGWYSVTTTEEKPYVIFISKQELSFKQGGIHVEFNHTYKNYKHYYISDKLTAGENKYYVKVVE